MAESTSSNHRRSYITFCSVCLSILPFSLFSKHFLEPFLVLAKDPVNEVKLTFLKNALVIRPYFE